MTLVLCQLLQIVGGVLFIHLAFGDVPRGIEQHGLAIDEHRDAGHLDLENRTILAPVAGFKA
jgi:hypothetical protein